MREHRNAFANAQSTKMGYPLTVPQAGSEKWVLLSKPACLAFAAAKMLKARESELPGTVVLLFQPAEEGGAGAQRMVQEGALEGVAGVFGEHAWPTMRSGLVASRVGNKWKTQINVQNVK